MAPPEIKIFWTRRATRHLHSAHEYWSREKSAAAADAMLERIFATAELLKNNPEMGRPRRIPRTRELVLLPTPFVLAYRAGRSKVEILAVLYGARKWPSHF
jgi:toxin ParE1/3/4